MQIKGILEEAVPKVTKTNKNYELVVINGAKFFNWGQWCYKYGIEVGDMVIAQVTEEQYPQVKSIALAEKALTQTDIKTFPVPTEQASVIKEYSNPSTSLQYLKLKLAVDLVKGESVDLFGQLEKAYVKMGELWKQ